MSVVESLSLGHAVQFTFPRSFQVRNPIIVLPLKQLIVELCTLNLSEIFGARWTVMEVTTGESLGSTNTGVRLGPSTAPLLCHHSSTTCPIFHVIFFVSGKV